MSDEVGDLPHRPTARVLLLDAADRILLLKGRLPGAEGGAGAWFTVGGGLEPGENYEQAAAREICEETGIVDVQLGPVVWLREGVLRIPHPVVFKERYILARCAGAEPRRDGWDETERRLIDNIRWWTLSELMTTSDPVFPPGLAERLPRLLSGPSPAAPERIPW